jgi:hypothetical protein
LLELKSIGAWDEIDILYVFATDGDSNFAKINWKNPGVFNCTAVNSPTHTENEGFAGNGSNAYLNTGWESANDGVNFTLNDCGVFAYVNNAVGSAILLGVEETGGASSNGQISLTAKNSLGNMAYSLNGAGVSIANGSSENGFYHSRRTASNASRIARNSTLSSNSTETSVSLTTRPLYILAYNNAGSAQIFGAPQISIFGAGASLNGLESDLYNAWNDYFNAL